MTRPHIVILGAGPAGLGAALRLRRMDRAEVTVVEQSPDVGGTAGGTIIEGIPCDFGSHRLHPSTPPEIMADIRALLGDDLLDRPRHGRIRLLGRWIHFPLKPLDLLLRTPPRFALGVAADLVRKLLPRSPSGPGGRESFASVLESGLGSTICRHFYFPYALKMWGDDPGKLSAIQARKRVSAGSLGRMFRKIAGALPGMKKPGFGRFYYPRKGFGQICHAYRDAGLAAGVNLLLSHRVTGVDLSGPRPRVTVESKEGPRTLDADHVWSTMPLTALARVVTPVPPPPVIAAADSMEFRSIVLAWLVVPVPRFTEFDAHYFPGTDIPMTRLSEPKNYSVRAEPADRTVLCAEIPCSMSDPVWTMDEAGLGDLVARGLAKAGIPLPAAPIAVHVRRLRTAYPIYRDGYEAAFNALDGHLGARERLLSFGRLGLFAHDNTHHALHMGYAAVDCLGQDGTFDSVRWAQCREDFRTHVVED